MKTMKNKMPIIFLLILISVIIFCLVMFLVIYLSKGEDEMLSIGSVSENVILEKTFEIANIENIEVTQEYGDITFEENSEDNIKVIIYGKNTGNANANLNHNKLEIDYKNRNNFMFFNFGLRKSEIKVYIPSTYAKEINTKVDCGNTKINSLENAILNAKCNAGNVELEKIKSANIKCDVGDVRAEEIGHKCNIELDTGNVKIEKLALKEDSKIKIDLGDVKIAETNDIYVEANTDLGDTKINKNNRTSNVALKINVDCGNIKVEN